MERTDGRPFDKIRKVTVTPDYIKFAEGSCLIELGNTRVVCTASVEESVPQFIKGTGSGWVTAEYGMLPRSCQNRIPRNKDSGRIYEIQRLIGRSLRVVTDLKAIGERTLWIDCDVLQADGGTRTISITGSFIALCFAFSRLRKQGLLEKIPLKDFVAAISVGIKGNELLLDLTYEEDSRVDVDMNVVMTAGGEYIEIQGTAERRTFDKSLMDRMLILAKRGIDELVDVQRDILKGLFPEDK